MNPIEPSDETKQPIEDQAPAKPQWQTPNLSTVELERATNGFLAS